MSINQLRARLGIIGIKIKTADTGILLHKHTVAALDQLIRTRRQQPNTVFVSLGFTGYTNNHGECLTPIEADGNLSANHDCAAGTSRF